MDGALLGYQPSWRVVESEFPQRFGHGAAAMRFGVHDVAVVHGGVARNEWHSSVVVLTGLSALERLASATAAAHHVRPRVAWSLPRGASLRCAAPAAQRS